MTLRLPGRPDVITDQLLDGLERFYRHPSFRNLPTSPMILLGRPKDVHSGAIYRSLNRLVETGVIEKTPLTLQTSQKVKLVRKLKNRPVWGYRFPGRGWPIEIEGGT